jgi:zinc transport system substrate-binding protein
MEPQVEKFLSEHASATRRVIVLADTVRASLSTAQEADHDDDHARDSHDHAHPGHDRDDHHHHGTDPHIWLDPVLVRAVVAECAAVLKSIPGTTAEESRRLDAAAAKTIARVDRIDADYRAALEKAPTRTIVVAHDAYGYLARRYRLDVIPISGLSAGEPQPGDVQKAAEIVRERRLTTIFIEPQLSPATAQRIAAATGAKTAVLDPLGDGDWFALMEKNLRALRGALAPSGTEPSP